MSETAESFQGVLEGQSIKLDRASSLPDGCMVNVTVRKARLPELEREAKLKSLFGGCSDDAADLDKFLSWNQEQRRINRSGAKS